MKWGKNKILDTISYKTLSANKKTVNKDWVLIDVEDLPLGRACSIIAKFLRGKYKTNFTPHVDCGDNVIIINASKISLSGKKWDQKQYISHSGYPGGQKSQTPIQIHKKNKTKLVEKSIKGMLPKNKLGASIYRNLKVYEGSDHKHESLKPKIINIKELL
mgnify:FL=1